MKINIPGRETITIENIVFDYNGTIAVGGEIIEGAGLGLESLKKLANIYILTADTYGTVEKECESLGVKVLTFPKENAGEEKRKIVEFLGGNKTICIGNGFNDIPMFKESALSIGIIEGEGACGKLLIHSDIICKSIKEAIELILDVNRIKATLRN